MADFKLPSIEFVEPVSIGNEDIFGGAQYFPNMRTLKVGSGNTSFNSNSAEGIWIGKNIFSGAPFSVDMQGNLTASSATISGTITATSGFIGGWQINPTTLTGGGVTLDSAGIITGGIIRTSASGQRVVMDGTTNQIDFFDGVFPVAVGVIKGQAGSLAFLASGTPPSELELSQGGFELQNGTWVFKAVGNNLTLEAGAADFISINAVSPNKEIKFAADLVPDGIETLGTTIGKWGGLFLEGNIEMEGNINIEGNIGLNGNLTVQGLGIFQDDIILGNSATISGDAFTRTIDRNWAPDNSLSGRQLGTATNKWKNLFLFAENTTGMEAGELRFNSLTGKLHFHDGVSVREVQLL